MLIKFIWMLLYRKILRVENDIQKLTKQLPMPLKKELYYLITLVMEGKMVLQQKEY